MALAPVLQNTGMNNAGVRVIDPILTQVILGYQNMKMVGSALFPGVPVAARGGQVLQFGKEAFKKYNMRRAPGGKTERMEIGYLGQHFATYQDRLEAVVPREHFEDAQAVIGIDLAVPSVKMAYDAILLGLEIDQANLATTAANYAATNTVALSGTSLWSDYTNSNPGEAMDGYREIIREQIGMYPNTLLLGPNVFNTLKRHPVLRAQFQYNTPATIDEEMMAGYFTVDKVVVGRGVYADDQDNMFNIWPDVAILAYVPPEVTSYMAPSFGYTYELKGSPFVQVPYFDDNRSSWQYPIQYDRVPVITGSNAGFLIQTPI
jgi:hypothetical protein